MNTTQRRRGATTLLLLCAAAGPLAAQAKEDPQDFIHDVFGAIFNPNWHVALGGGLTTNGQLMLQRPSPLAAGERALETNTGGNFTAGAGVDILLRMGFRAAYTFTSNTLEFTTSNGDGTHTLDLGSVATLKSHTASVEIVRYMLPARALFTPYATAGLQGTWWQLSDETVAVDAAGGSTQFRWGGLVTFGFASSFWNHWGARIEATKAGIGSPFSGRNSFRAPSGWTIDEPTSVGQSNYRLMGVYYFAMPKIK